MLQMQAPADLIRMLQSGQGVNAEAKTAKDVQGNVNKVAMELEFRTEKLAACVTTLTGDLESIKQQHEILIRTAHDQQAGLSTMDGAVKALTERIQHLETAIAHISRQQVSLESTLAIRVEAVEERTKATLLQHAQSSPVDALADEIGSMKTVLSRLECTQEELEKRSRSKFEELAKSLSLGNERAADMDTRLRLALERIVGNERLCEKLRKADADLEAQLQELVNHFEEESPSTPRQTAAAENEDETQDNEELPKTPKAAKQPVEFKMTPHMDNVTWQKDDTSGWLEDDGLESSAAAVLREMPKLNTTSSEAWEKGMAFRQWTTEMAAIAEAIHPSFAEYFRSKLSEGQTRYEKRLDQGYAEPASGVRVEDKEMETRLPLALLRVIPAKMKAHALEGGTTEEGISTAQLMEAVYEHMAPGGVRERSSLLQYLRAPPPANNGEELMNTLRRFRLAQQRAVHLGTLTQPAHELVAALDAMVRPLERKHQPLSVRLGILRLQANIQLPTADGVELYAKILETEGIKLQAEEVNKPKGGRADSQSASEEYTVPSASQAESGGKGGGKKGVRVCAYYNSARGCLKGAECEFRHEDPQPKGKGTKGGRDAKGTEKGSFVEDREVPSLAGADSVSMVLSSSGDDLTERGEIPTYSEASTPEWSDVEHGNVVSPVSSQDSEIELIGPRHPPAPLWALNLSLNEFLEWCRPGRVQEFALGQFEEVTNVNSILWPVWWTIERDMLDDDERGVIPVTDEVRMMKLSTTMILFSDGIIRPVFLAWLLDEMSGRDRTVAIIREPARPIVRPYPAQTGAATPELSKAAPPKFGRVAKSPTVSPPPLGYTQQPDEANDDPPWLAGAGMKEGTAYRLECDDQPAACAVVSEHPSVLVDSGANETIRPWTQGFSEAGCKRTSVVTASGDRIPALRTRDGELRIQSSHDTKDWLLSVRRLVEAGGSFDWTPEAAVVTYVDAGGKMQQVQCKITLEWEEFRPIRVALSQAYRGKQTRASVAVGAEDDLKTSEACTMEVLNEIMCAEEVYRLSAAEKDEEVRAVWSSEARAKELLNQDALTYEAVWQVVQEAHLKGQRTRRQEKMVDQSSDRVQIWIFGMFCHGGMSGVTNITRQRPFLCKLLVRFLKQELPTLSFTTIALAIDATLKPHRDLANAKYSLAGILGLSEFEGGKLWIEDAEGKIKRRVTQDQIKTGVLLDISQQAKIFDSRRWHGADKHRGTRATLTGYTARQLYNLDHDLVETLRNLGFQLPPTAKAGTASSISDQHAAINNTTCSTSKHTSTLTTSLTSPETQDEDDDDDDDGVSVFGFAGFVNSGTSGRCEDCGVVLEGLRRDSEPPWTALAAEIEGASSGFDEAAQQRALDLLQRKCAEGLYEKKCPDCLESHGHKRKCRRLTADMVSKGTLSMDLSGPHPASFAGHRYFLAANLSVEDGEDIPFSRLLFTKKTEEVARALISVMCQIVSLAQGGARVMVVRDGATSVRVVRLPVLKDKPVARWKLERGLREGVVWISTTGDLRWDAPPSDMITVEESVGEIQPWNDVNAASEILRAFMVAPEPEAVDPDPVAAVAHQEEFQRESTEGFYRVYDVATEDSMNELETAVQLLADEEAVGEPVSTNIFFTGTPEEKKIWYDAAKTEVDNMVSSNAWVEVRVDHAHVDLNLDRSKKLPRALPMTLVCTRKPLIMQDDQPTEQVDTGQVVQQLLEPSIKGSQSASAVQAHERMRYKPKVRLCVCGNFQEAQPHLKDENAAETVPIEIVRLMLALLARNPSWNALSLDVSAAFLNAELGNKETILMKPPLALVKLGLIPAGVWLRALRAIYGLRQSPARWEELRDSVLKGAVLHPEESDALPILIVEAFQGTGGVFLIRHQVTSELVGMLCVFVDDVLAIGSAEVVLRTGQYILNVWKGKLQGMLSRSDDQSWSRGSLEVKAVAELVFIGIQIFLKNETVAMTQQKWTIKQLNIRGFLHIKGSPSLPATEEGKLSKGDEDQCNAKLIKEAQRELGALLWLATKTRPDLASTVGILATLVVLRPDLVLQKTVGVWKYVRHTMFYGIEFGPDNTNNVLSLESDASFGSGGSRSRSGHVIRWGSNVLMYRSARQTLTAHSTCEAETGAMADAIADMLKIAIFVGQVGEISALKAEGDNAASLATLAKARFQETLWRTRHFALRASWVRDMLREHGIELSHKAREELSADLLTKTLARVKLEQFRKQVSVVKLHEG
ncbi:unnamed protein product [Symbiodinium pilosum]|uniref:C3H1-type domain-containing protein n=1 Tax=Symbiodinium pilosum TaxID=2952 RepID=A0A812QR70_SYMPI|nr:unnamed protein product [Symbiodinium pilosum]